MNSTFKWLKYIFFKKIIYIYMKLIVLFNILPKRNLNIWLKVDWQGVIRVCSYFGGTKWWRNNSVAASGFGDIILTKLPST